MDCPNTRIRRYGFWVDHDEMTTLGQRVAYYRKLNGLSAEDLSRLSGAGLTRAVITNLENERKTDVTVEQLISLSSSLGVPPVALVFDITHPEHINTIRRTVGDNSEKHVMATWETIDWFSGWLEMPWTLQSDAGRESSRILSSLRTYKRKQLERRELVEQIARSGPGSDPKLLDELRAELEAIDVSLLRSARILKIQDGIDVEARESGDLLGRVWNRG